MQILITTHSKKNCSDFNLEFLKIPNIITLEKWTINLPSTRPQRILESGIHKIGMFRYIFVMFWNPFISFLNTSGTLTLWGQTGMEKTFEFLKIGQQMFHLRQL